MTRAMIRQICNVKPRDTATIRSTEQLARLGIEDLDLTLKERRLCWYDTWNAPTVQSRQPLTYRLMESMGLGGTEWLGGSWQRRIAESGSFRLSNLKTKTPGDLVWDLPCVQQASYLERGHWCGYCPCTCTLVKIWWWWWRADPRAKWPSKRKKGSCNKEVAKVVSLCKNGIKACICTHLKQQFTWECWCN